MSSWDQYWQKSHLVNPDSPQESVGRVLDGKPVDNKIWLQTVDKVTKALKIDSESLFLDLCGGNGLLSGQMSIVPKALICADLNADLLSQVSPRSISRVQADVRQLPFLDLSFTSIAMYAAIQYLSETESVFLFEKLFSLLKENGRVFIGDIPDYDSRMKYFSMNSRIDRYFNSIKIGRPMIGNWFERNWIRSALQYSGFSHVEILEQDEWEPYASFRFDVVAEK